MAWIAHELHGTVAHNNIPGLDVRILLGCIPECYEEEAVGHLHDVGIVDTEELLPPILAGPVQGEIRDSVRARPGNDFQTLRDHCTSSSDIMCSIAA